MAFAQTQLGAVWTRYLPKRALLMVRPSEAARVSVSVCCVGLDSFSQESDLLLEKMMAGIGIASHDFAVEFFDKQLSATNWVSFGLRLSDMLSKGSKAVLIVGHKKEVLEALESVSLSGSGLFGLLQSSCVLTYSPEHLLENPALKREAWEDLKRLARLLGPA